VSIPGKSVHLDPRAPARIVRAAHKRLADVDYLVLTGIAGTPRWQAYFKHGPNYTADATGQKVHRLP